MTQATPLTPILDDPTLRVAPSALERLCETLRADERLVWADQPPRLGLVFQTLPRFLIGIPLTALLILWTLVAWTMMVQGGEANLNGNVEVFGMLYPVAAPVLGLIVFGFLTAPLFAWRHQAPNTLFVLTDQRALAWYGRLYAGVYHGDLSWEEQADDSPQRPDPLGRFDGRGALVFANVATEPPPESEPKDHDPDPPEAISHLIFKAVRDPDRVARLAIQLKGDRLRVLQLRGTDS